ADIVLNDLPFVDGPPAEGQSRISWIKNGEEILGADTQYGSEGSMNRPTVSVLRNVEVLDKNIGILKTSLETANSDIKTIQEAGYIPEAPRDGQAYVRKDGEWVLLSTFL
uniref:Fibritin n=1 Tax=Enterobacteria phage T4 TaxID=10665 RepID=UPI0000358883|nr:Chain A, Fibritin [Tequatrovirus T4]